MSRSDRILLAAVAVSVALHIAALFGTPRFDLERLYEDARQAPPIEVRIAVRTEPPPAKVVAAKPLPRAVRKAQPARAPAAAEPPVLATQSLLDAPSPDGEPVPEAHAAAENGPPEGATNLAEQPTPQLLAEEAPRTDYPFKRARLVYDLLYMNRPNGGDAATKIGHVTHTWSQDGEGYEAESVAEAVGLVWLFFNGRLVQRSTGRFDADGLRPATYTLHRGGRGDKSEMARFDWAAGKLAFAWKNESRVVELPEGAQDPLSILHHLYFVQPVRASGEVAIATSRKLYRSSVDFVGEEALEMPLGILHALHFRHREPDGSAIELWADLERQLLPARVRAIDRKGNVFDLVLRDAELEPAEPKPN